MTNTKKQTNKGAALQKKDRWFTKRAYFGYQIVYLE